MMKQIYCSYIDKSRKRGFMVIYLADDNVFNHIGMRIWI